MTDINVDEKKRATRLALKLVAVIKWLEENEPSVFAHGLWDAISEAEELADRLNDEEVSDD